MIESIEQYNNKHPPAKPVVFHFRAVSPDTAGGTQAALVTARRLVGAVCCPQNGPSPDLTFFP